MCTPRTMHCCPSFPRTGTPTRACSRQGAGSAVPCTAARLMMAYFQGQTPRLPLLPSPVTTEHQARDPARCFGCLPSSSSFSSALHPFPTTCCVSRDHSHAIGRPGQSLGTFAMLSAYNTSGVPCPGHRGHPSLHMPGTAPSSPQLGVWAPTWAGPFQGPCGPAWRDRQATCSAKGSDRWKKRDKFHPELPV